MLTKAQVQRLRSLRDKRHREELGLFAVEGPKVVTELLGARFPFAELYATPDWLGRNRAAAAGIGAIVEISATDMARISHFPTPSDVLAVGPICRTPLDRDSLRQGFTLALDGVQDAGNVGTLLRIADWYGFDRVLLSPDCADLFHAKVIHASMGSFARVRAHSAELTSALAGLSSQVPVLGCDLTGRAVHSLPAMRAGVVVVGSEGRGMSPSIIPLLSERITIPRYGGAESLNAAVAAAVVCDNLRRIAG